jgi:hypothetical protein
MNDAQPTKHPAKRKPVAPDPEKSVVFFFSMSRHKAELTVKKSWENIKNYDRNGPEGQFRTTCSALCNAGLSPWYPCFLIQVYPIKVSMRKEKRRRGQKMGRAARNL